MSSIIATALDIMERKGPPISLDEFRRRFSNRLPTERSLTPLERISAVQQAVQGVIENAEERYADISEDAYVTRNEARQHLAFLGEFHRKVLKAKPGGTVDLRKKVTDYGYDPEDAAAAQDAGVVYKTEAERAKSAYWRHIRAVRDFLPLLENAGVRVKVGFKRVAPTDTDHEF